MSETVGEDKLKFHLEEYRLLKADIAYHTKLIDECFIWATLASGIIAAWLLTNSDKIALLGGIQGRIAWFIPFFIAALGCLLFYHFLSVIGTMAAYIQRLEPVLALPAFGWETYGGLKAEKSVISFSTMRFALAWSVLLLADLCLAIFVG